MHGTMAVWSQGERPDARILIRDKLEVGEQTAINLVSRRRRNQQTSHHGVSRL
jgi:hypothetical protein